MSLIETMRSAGAAILRRTPKALGQKKISRSLNEATLKRGAAPIVSAPMKNGTKLYVDLRTKSQFLAYYTGEYDSRLLEPICALLDADATVFDIGANIGFYTVAIAHHLRSRGGSGRVFGFEPLPKNYERLVENIARNGLEDRCTTFDFGLSSEAREHRITLREDFGGGADTGNASIPTNEKFDAGFAQVPIRLERLDDWMAANAASCPRIDFVKMDIEGHEDFCLEGGAEVFRHHRPVILMEVNRPYYAARGVDIDERFPPLIPDAYTVYRHDGTSWVPTPTFSACRRVDNVFLVPSEKPLFANSK